MEGKKKRVLTDAELEEVSGGLGTIIIDADSGLPKFPCSLLTKKENCEERSDCEWTTSCKERSAMEGPKGLF